MFGPLSPAVRPERLVEYYCVVGLARPLVAAASKDSAARPISDVVLLYGSEPPPAGYEKVELTVSGGEANLSAGKNIVSRTWGSLQGSLQGALAGKSNGSGGGDGDDGAERSTPSAPHASVWLAISRAPHPMGPLTDMSLLYLDRPPGEGGRLPPGWTLVPGDANHGSYGHVVALCVARGAAGNAATSGGAGGPGGSGPILDLVVVNQSARESVPSGYHPVGPPGRRNLNGGSFRDEVVLAFRRAPRDRFARTAFKARVLDRFPRADLKAAGLPEQSVAMFTFPQGVQLVRGGAPPPAYTGAFVLAAGEKGQELYGSYVTFYEAFDEEEAEMEAGAGAEMQGGTKTAASATAAAAVSSTAGVAAPPALASSRSRRSLGGVAASSAMSPSPSPLPSALYAPRALVLLSAYPFYRQMILWLQALYRCSRQSMPSRLPLERVVANLFETPLPRPGWIKVVLRVGGQVAPQPPPPSLPAATSNGNSNGAASAGRDDPVVIGGRVLVFDRPGSADFPGLVNFPLVFLFRLLSFPNVIILLSALLAERKVVLVSSRPQAATWVAEGLRTLMLPLKWVNPFVPTLPASMVELGYLDAPMPFFAGVCSGGFGSGSASGGTTGGSGEDQLPAGCGSGGASVTQLLQQDPEAVVAFLEVDELRIGCPGKGGSSGSTSSSTSSSTDGGGGTATNAKHYYSTANLVAQWNAQMASSEQQHSSGAGGEGHSNSSNGSSNSGGTDSAASYTSSSSSTLSSSWTPPSLPASLPLCGLTLLPPLLVSRLAKELRAHTNVFRLRRFGAAGAASSVNGSGSSTVSAAPSSSSSSSSSASAANAASLHAAAVAKDLSAYFQAYSSEAEQDCGDEAMEDEAAQYFGGAAGGGEDHAHAHESESSSGGVSVAANVRAIRACFVHLFATLLQGVDEWVTASSAPANGRPTPQQRQGGGGSNASTEPPSPSPERDDALANGGGGGSFDDSFSTSTPGDPSLSDGSPSAVSVERLRAQFLAGASSKSRPFLRAFAATQAFQHFTEELLALRDMTASVAATAAAAASSEGAANGAEGGAGGGLAGAPGSNSSNSVLLERLHELHFFLDAQAYEAELDSALKSLARHRAQATFSSLGSKSAYAAPVNLSLVSFLTATGGGAGGVDARSSFSSSSATAAVYLVPPPSLVGLDARASFAYNAFPCPLNAALLVRPRPVDLKYLREPAGGRKAREALWRAQQAQQGDGFGMGMGMGLHEQVAQRRMRRFQVDQAATMLPQAHQNGVAADQSQTNGVNPGARRSRSMILGSGSGSGSGGGNSVSSSPALGPRSTVGVGQLDPSNGVDRTPPLPPQQQQQQSLLRSQHVKSLSEVPAPLVRSTGASSITVTAEGETSTGTEDAETPEGIDAFDEDGGGGGRTAGRGRLFIPPHFSASMPNSLAPSPAAGMTPTASSARIMAAQQRGISSSSSSSGGPFLPVQRGGSASQITSAPGGPTNTATVTAAASPQKKSDMLSSFMHFITAVPVRRSVPPSPSRTTGAPQTASRSNTPQRPTSSQRRSLPPDSGPRPAQSGPAAAFTAGAPPPPPTTTVARLLLGGGANGSPQRQSLSASASGTTTPARPPAGVGLAMGQRQPLMERARTSASMRASSTPRQPQPMSQQTQPQQMQLLQHSIAEGHTAAAGQ